MEEDKDSGASASLSLSDNESPPPASMPFVPAPATTVINTCSNAGMSTGVTSIVNSADLSGKKKRGRPRKYDADGNLRIPVKSPSLTGFTLTSPKSEFSSKRGRGRPLGSGNWQVLASLGELFTSTAGGDFTPHVMTIYGGEDIASKIISFSQKGSRGICVLSANGAVSNVTIRQPGSSGGILTYEGRFEILSLTGSFTVSDKDGMRSRTGGLSVSLAGPDGRVIGGSVAGLLMAASPIQIVVGSFMENGFSKSLIKKKHQNEPRVAAEAVTIAPVTPAMPISQSIPAGNFIVQNHIDSAADNDGTNGVHNINCGWNGTNSTLLPKTSPDINSSVPFEMN
ncbi:AT-hook motif nuclear-localized protein 7-like [Impatiens glandulifera]|uniref:AT-hook motif nuclear-localized protein 7-like n=1 Tax=Impatiens glandulifera TaxID=253017 RepID=UPI001FB0ACD4|nr:AT-hook motif nuclear-localized protein 7-like [Impatiens glandulifera]